MENEFRIVPITSRRIIDMTGETYGRLVVLGLSNTTTKRGARWVCQCSCGKKTITSRDNLIGGHTSSCGCYHREGLSKRNTTHGAWGTRLYKIWNGMKQRCTNPNDSSYFLYGKRGITVCQEWEESFESFAKWAKNNGYRDDLSIDRIDNNGNYQPDNCRFATDQEQAENTRRTIMIEHNGETHALTKWTRLTGIDITALRERYYRGDRGDRLFRPVGSENWSTMIEYNGKTHNLTEWSKITGINSSTLSDRFHKGDRGDRLFRPVGSNNGSTMIEYNGEAHNIAEWSKITGINRRTLSYRYRKGDRGDRLFRPVENSGGIMVEYDGKTHNLTEWSKITGIKESTLWARYDRGDRDSRLFRPIRK